MIELHSLLFYAVGAAANTDGTGGCSEVTLPTPTLYRKQQKARCCWRRSRWLSSLTELLYTQRNPMDTMPHPPSSLQTWFCPSYNSTTLVIELTWINKSIIQTITWVGNKQQAACNGFLLLLLLEKSKQQMALTLELWPEHSGLITVRVNGRVGTSTCYQRQRA